MASTIKIKRSAVAAKVPTTGNLELGELAVNTYDGKLYMKKNDGSDAVVQIGGAHNHSASASAIKSGRNYTAAGHVPVAGTTYAITFDAASTGPCALGSYDLVTEEGYQIPADYIKAGEILRVFFDGTAYRVQAPTRIYRRGKTVAATYRPDGSAAWAMNVKTAYLATWVLQGTAVLPTPYPSEIPVFSAVPSTSPKNYTANEASVRPAVLFATPDNIRVDLWRVGTTTNFASGDYGHVNVTAQGRWFPLATKRLDSAAALYPFYNPNWAAWTTPAPTGTGSTNVVQSAFVDYAASEIIVMQESGSVNYFRRLNISTGAPIGTGYELAVSGTHLHQGFHWDGTYYWSGSRAGITPRIHRIARSGGARTEFLLDLSLSRAGTWSGNLTMAVNEAANLVAMRVQDPDGVNVVFVGSWSGLKSSSATWVADHVIDLDETQAADVFQGIALGAGYVICSTGYNEPDGAKNLIAYDFAGKILDHRGLWIGRDFAQDRYEPESLTIYSDGVDEYLVIGIITGNGANVQHLFRAKASVV